MMSLAIKLIPLMFRLINAILPILAGYIESTDGRKRDKLLTKTLDATKRFRDVTEGVEGLVRRSSDPAVIAANKALVRRVNKSADDLVGALSDKG